VGAFVQALIFRARGALLPQQEHLLKQHTVLAYTTTVIPAQAGIQPKIFNP
jgi:hypothetical protein